MTEKVMIIVTLGPATNTEEHLRSIKDKGVDFVRVNMSHSSIEDLRHFIKMAKRVGIPFIIDTEGSQVRIGDLTTRTIELENNALVKIYASEIVGDQEKFNLKPTFVVPQLEVGDLIHLDFDTITLCVADTSTINEGYITARVITGGQVSKNKAAVVDTASHKKIELPTLSEKDYQSIQVGLEEGIGHIAVSFVRSGAAVDEVRQATQNTMKIISKVECVDGLEHLEDITRKSDYLLMDRGDMSNEVPIEKLPFIQKIILNKAKKYGTGVFIATNFLESMITQRRPTRAEIHDIIATIVDGAQGLTLAAETAIGKHPLECINMLNKLIKHAQLAVDKLTVKDKEDAFVKSLEDKNYLFDFNLSSSLIEPHGGKLVDRMAKREYSQEELTPLPSVTLSDELERDVEQIALGTYSPLEGFMAKNDFSSVLDRMRLANGLVWSMPIVLDVSDEKARELTIGKDVALKNKQGEIVALLHLEDIYQFDKEDVKQKMYSTTDQAHPGVRLVDSMQPNLLAGKITLLQRKKNDFKAYELTPRQARTLFEKRGWSKVVAFHTRNVIHKGHEFLQVEAMKRMHCDGLFAHPVVGKKKPGDFKAPYIIKAYEKMIADFYPKNRAIFGTFSTYSRYAGPREALFTALCRQNFGCSHFIIGRDHTGVGNFYHPKASHNIFDRFPEVGIKPVRFDKVFYSKHLGKHLHERDVPEHDPEDKHHISGTQVRQMFEQGQTPPEWFMRPEIAQIISESIQKGEDVFVREP